MARWKALYLFRGYDKASSVLQILRTLAPLDVPDEEITLPDGTKPSGDWSVRELYKTLDQVLQGSSPIWPASGPGFTLGDLMWALYKKDGHDICS